jgi:hypothetical protein
VTVGQPGSEPDPDLAQDQIPAGVPERVVDLLEAVEIEQDGQPTLRTEGYGCLPDPFAEQRTVGQAGQGIMEGLVLAFGGRPVQIVDQLAAGQGAARLAGQGLEQGQILPAEGADVAETVGHQEGPERPGASSHGATMASAIPRSSSAWRRATSSMVEDTSRAARSARSSSLVSVRMVAATSPAHSDWVTTRVKWCSRLSCSCCSRNDA